MHNSIVWGNDEGVTATGTVGGGCSISQNGVGGTATDPLFTTTLRGSYRLSAASPAIDQCQTGTGRDLDDVARPQGGSYDMGAFEYGSTPTAVTVVQTQATPYTFGKSIVIMAVGALSAIVWARKRKQK